MLVGHPRCEPVWILRIVQGINRSDPNSARRLRRDAGAGDESQRRRLLDVLGTRRIAHQRSQCFDPVCRQTCGGRLGRHASRRNGWLHRDAGGPTEIFATSESSVDGTQTGDLSDTTAIDAVFQTLSEELYSRRNRKSRLEHRWSFDLSGQTALNFLLDAEHLTPSDPDDFRFQYSLDGGQTWINLLTVRSSTSGVQTVGLNLPIGTSEVTVRVIDTDGSNDRSSARFRPGNFQAARSIPLL